MTDYIIIISFTLPYLIIPTLKTLLSTTGTTAEHFKTHHTLFDPNKPKNTVLDDKM